MGSASIEEVIEAALAGSGGGSGRWPGSVRGPGEEAGSATTPSIAAKPREESFESLDSEDGPFPGEGRGPTSILVQAAPGPALEEGAHGGFERVEEDDDNDEEDDDDDDDDDGTTGSQSLESTSSSTKMRMVLGRLSKRVGGTTGIVLSSNSLDDDDDDDDSDEVSFMDTLGGEKSPTEATGMAPVGAEGYVSNVDIETNEARALMKVLCAHLLPYGVANSASKATGPEDRSELAKSADDEASDDSSSLDNPSWDDDDPDEPGYLVYRLRTSQLELVEIEFEQMVKLVRQSSERKLSERNDVKAEDKSGTTSSPSAPSSGGAAGTDAEFQRDLEEAEAILDLEEKRVRAEEAAAAGKVISEDESGSDDESRSTESKDGSKDYDDSSQNGAFCSGSGTKSTRSAESDGPSPQNKDLIELTDATSALHLAGNPDFPHVYPSGQGQKGDMELFHLPIIYKSQQTGFEPTKDISMQPGAVFAAQYLVQNELGSAAFSTAYRCIDLHSGEVDEDGEEYHEEVCLKVIKNTKDFFDQSLDEIKVLELLRRTGQCDENCVVEMKTFFYHREHLVIVTELLRQNLYEFGKFIIENDEPAYFTLPRLSSITRQSLIALNFTHKLGLVHSDVKPENILLSSYSKAKVKLIDFGSACYLTDRQSSYIQSRSYRAPEVILGLPYDGKIDIWSLGCVIAEMFTGHVTFQNDSVVSMLSRIEAICGAFPRHLIANGRQSGEFFTPIGLLYEKADVDDDDSHSTESSSEEDRFNVFQPKRTTLAARLGFDANLMERERNTQEEEQQAMFVDFLRSMLTIDPDLRPTAEEALQHPWILSSLELTEEEIKYPPEE